jgi:hypothetical protein
MSYWNFKQENVIQNSPSCPTCALDEWCHAFGEPSLPKAKIDTQCCASPCYWLEYQYPQTALVSQCRRKQ